MWLCERRCQDAAAVVGPACPIGQLRSSTWHSLLLPCGAALSASFLHSPSPSTVLVPPQVMRSSVPFAFVTDAVSPRTHSASRSLGNVATGGAMGWVAPR